MSITDDWSVYVCIQPWGPIYKISYDNLIYKFTSLIYKTSYEGRKAFLRYDSLAKL